MSQTYQPPPPSTGGQSSGLTVQHYETSMGAITVPINTLQNLKNASIDDSKSFAVAEFMIVGPAFLALERHFTVKDWDSDPLFLVCAAIAIGGIWPVVSAWRQMKRRHGEIDELIENAKPKQSSAGKGLEQG